MALLDILTGRSSSGGRVPPLAMALLGLLAYNKLKKPADAAPGGQPGFAERLEDFFKPAATGGGPTAKGVIGALLTGMGVVMITTTIAVIIGLCVVLWWTHRID